MAAEATEDLSKSQKRELKWERKQAKVKAAAAAAGQTYFPPTKEAKDAATDKMGKRKKRKLAALQQDGAADLSVPINAQSSDAKQKKHKQPSEPLVNGTAAQNDLDLASGAVDQSKADKKAAKKAKKAAAAAASATTADESPAAANGTADTAEPKKKKKKVATATITEAAQPSDTQPALPGPSAKKQKKSAGSAPPHTPHGRVMAHQEAVLASVGDQELAKSGKSIQKDLYKEHPSVSAMSEGEVKEHRAARDTAVAGADLRPVLQFDQAGNHLLPLVINCTCWLTRCDSQRLFCHVSIGPLQLQCGPIDVLVYRLKASMDCWLEVHHCTTV